MQIFEVLVLLSFIYSNFLFAITDMTRDRDKSQTYTNKNKMSSDTVHAKSQIQSFCFKGDKTRFKKDSEAKSKN